MAPAIGCSIVGGSGAKGGTEAPTAEWPRRLTTVVTAAVAGESDAASTVTAKVSGAPTVAAALTLSVIFSSTARLAGSLPIVHLVPWAAGHSVNRGNVSDLALLDAPATTLVAGTVLQTQIEYVTMPPGRVLEPRRTSCPLTQSAPALCERLGDGEGLADLVPDFDGDGLGERDLDGLGLLVGDGLGLFVVVGLVDPIALSDGLAMVDDVAPAVGLADPVVASRCADLAAAEPCPHGEPAGLAVEAVEAVEAKVGAMAIADARNKPPAMATATRGSRSQSRRRGRAVSSSMTGVLTVRLGGHVFEHKLAARRTEMPGGNARAYRFIMICFTSASRASSKWRSDE